MSGLCKVARLKMGQIVSRFTAALPVRNEIKLNIYNYSHFIGIETTNLANQHNVDALKKILESINTSELEAQFCHYINSHTHDQDFKSQLGLLCLKKDYDARITAKVTQDIDREHLYRVSINVNIPIEPT